MENDVPNFLKQEKILSTGVCFETIGNICNEDEAEKLGGREERQRGIASVNDETSAIVTITRGIEDAESSDEKLELPEVEVSPIDEELPWSKSSRVFTVMPEVHLTSPSVGG